MAEITSGDSRKKQNVGVERTRKLSTRVDLTPMVDLGFLLITFFIFTTALSQPKALNLIMPNDTRENTPTRESGALTLIPGSNGVVFYYEGIFKSYQVKRANMNAIRDVIIDKKRRTRVKALFVIIKPSNDANYGDVVKLLDEMTINDVKRYAIVDISQDEVNLIQ